jgi:hypothetical protein
MCGLKTNLYDLRQHQKTIKIMKNIGKSILTLGTSFFLTGITSPTASQEIDLETLCSKFPLNSRCQNQNLNYSANQSDKTQLKTRQLDREMFCNQFPFNSKCQGKPVEVIKFNLNRSGEDDEWIRIERKGDIVQLLHTTKVKDGLVSGILNGAVGLIPSPILPDVNKYNWQDHRVLEVSFKSDRCKTNDCISTGENTLKIPKETDIYQGIFTIQYQEEDLVRAITFKIPPDIKAEISNTITVSTPIQK